MKIIEIDEQNIAEILNNYNHPQFEMAFQMIEEKNFETDGNTNQQPTTTHGNHSGRMRRANPSMHEILKAL